MDSTATETVTAYRCLECEHVAEETAGSLYECGQDGEVFTQDTSADGGSNRCPQCNKFGAKIADDGCVECNAGEVEQIQAVEIDGDLIAIDADVPPEQAVSQALARRAADRLLEQERKDARDRELKEQEQRLAALPRVRAADVLPGDTLGYHDPRSTFEPYVFDFKVGRVGPDTFKKGRIRLAPPGGMGFQFVCDPDDEFALVDRPDETPDNEQSLEERLRDAFKS